MNTVSPGFDWRVRVPPCASTSLLEQEPLLFEPPFHELQHLEDGRKWRVRTSGAGIEIEIALSEGTLITRKRACATATQAEQETAALIAEQVADGFTELRA